MPVTPAGRRSCGAAYWCERWDGAAWRTVVEPGDEDRAWVAMAIGVFAHSEVPKHFTVPLSTRPGRHRVCKVYDAESVGVGEVTVHTEFTVVA